MKKFLASLLILFLACTTLHSQSTADSTIPRKDSSAPIIYKKDSSDPIVNKKDSSTPVIHKKRIRPRPAPDTVRRLKTDDSLFNSLIPISVSRNWIADLKQMLSEHPYFNFAGKVITRPEIRRIDQNNDLIFYLLLGLFFYFALIKTFFSKYVNNLIAIFLRITLKQQQLKEQLLLAPLPSMLLNVLFF